MKLLIKLVIAMSVCVVTNAWDSWTSTSCEQRCVNGKCMGWYSEICSCDGDYKPDSPFNSIAKCVPKCNPDTCFGECVTPGICRCESITIGTFGFEICEPECPESCKTSNGYCSEANVCNCKTGYKLKQPESDRCIPVCDGGCNSGICVEPNVCKCNEGFVNQNSSNCRPVCENGCKNGYCVSPGQCVCKPGFTKDATGVCKFCPKTCYHGTCDHSTYQCTCDFGYTGEYCERDSVCAVYFDSTESLFLKFSIANSEASYDYGVFPTCQNDCKNNEKLLNCGKVKDREFFKTVCFLDLNSPCNLNDSSSDYSFWNNLKTYMSLFYYEVIILVCIVFILIVIIRYYFVHKRGRAKPTGDIEEKLIDPFTVKT